MVPTQRPRGVFPSPPTVVTGSVTCKDRRRHEAQRLKCGDAGGGIGGLIFFFLARDPKSKVVNPYPSTPGLAGVGRMVNQSSVPIYIST